MNISGSIILELTIERINRAILNIYRHIAAYGTGSQCITRETTTATKDVTVHVRGTRDANANTRVGICCRTNGNAATDVGYSIANDVTVLTTTERRTKDTGIARNIDFGFSDVRPSVEVDTLVTLTCTEEITGYRVIGNSFQRAWYTQRTARHVDGALSCSAGRR